MTDSACPARSSSSRSGCDDAVDGWCTVRAAARGDAAAWPGPPAGRPAGSDDEARGPRTGGLRAGGGPAHRAADPEGAGGREQGGGRRAHRRGRARAVGPAACGARRVGPGCLRGRADRGRGRAVRGHRARPTRTAAQGQPWRAPRPGAGGALRPGAAGRTAGYRRGRDRSAHARPFRRGRVQDAAAARRPGHPDRRGAGRGRARTGALDHGRAASRRSPGRRVRAAAERVGSERRRVALMPARPNAAGPTIAGARPLPGRRARGGQGRRAVALAAAALGLFGPSTATPQTLGISAGGAVIRSGPATTAGAMIVAPALELGGAGSSLRLDGQFARLMDGGVAAELSGVGTWLHPVRAGLAAGGRIEGRWSAFPRERDAGGMRAMLNATFGGPALGAAAGLGVGRFRAPADTRTTTHWEAAGWTRVGPVRLHASAAVNAFDERFTMLRDSVIVSPDSTLSPHRTAAAARSRRYADAEVGAEWRPGRLALHLVWGARVGDAATAAESWGRAAASYVLRDGLALTAAAGVMPASIERGLRRAPFGR